MGALVFWLLIIGWPVGVIWGYRRAVAAGYSELVALVGVILLGPFAPLLALVKPSGNRCAYCRSVIDRAATVCPKCAREQPASEQQR